MFRHHRISTGIALAVALTLAAAAPAAVWARPDPPDGQAHPQPEVHLRSGDATNPAVASIQAQGARVARELAARAAADKSAIATPPPKIVKIFQHNGFLIDAVIGAGITLGLVLVLLGSSLYITHRRRGLPINPAH